jgi:hypothetical protein
VVDRTTSRVNPGKAAQSMYARETTMPTHVPVGSILTRVYWRIPNWTGDGPEFPDHQTAADHARREWERRQAAAHGGVTPIRPYIDERWVMQYPHGGSADLLAQRTQFGTGTPLALLPDAKPSDPGETTPGRPPSSLPTRGCPSPETPLREK